MSNRYFVKKGGFQDDTLLIRCEGETRNFLVLKDGTEGDGGSYELAHCLNYVKEGRWVELMVQAGEPLPTPTSEWLPIETAPKDADVLLLWADGWGVQPGYWYAMDKDESKHRWICCETQGLTGGGMGDDGPTHWMPLPAVPASAVSPSSEKK